jgi:hypothetical protein
MAVACGTPSIVRAEETPKIHVYHSADCKCCGSWVKYLESKGFSTEVTTVENPTAIKPTLGIPLTLYACHTAVVDGYLIEGHVAAEDIRRLLEERPKVRGLVVLGMPRGSGGIDSPDPEKYQTLAFDADGTPSIFATHDPAKTETENKAPPATDSQSK